MRENWTEEMYYNNWLCESYSLELRMKLDYVRNQIEWNLIVLGQEGIPKVFYPEKI